MNWSQFNATAVVNENPDARELDLRPFGALQDEAAAFWLEGAAAGGEDRFGKTVTLKMDASVVLSADARANLAKLQQQGYSISVVGER